MLHGVTSVFYFIFLYIIQVYIRFQYKPLQIVNFIIFIFSNLSSIDNNSNNNRRSRNIKMYRMIYFCVVGDFFFLCAIEKQRKKFKIRVIFIDRLILLPTFSQPFFIFFL